MFWTAREHRENNCGNSVVRRSTSGDVKECSRGVSEDMTRDGELYQQECVIDWLDNNKFD